MRQKAAGSWEMLLVTTRSTRRRTAPKGWLVKNFKAHEAAAIEGIEEASVLGSVKKKPLGGHLYWKRMQATFKHCKVRLYPMHVRPQLAHWPEEFQRDRYWFSLEMLLIWSKSLGFGRSKLRP